MKNGKIITVLLVLVMAWSCRDKDLLQEDEVLKEHLLLPDQPFNYQVGVPEHLNKELILKQDNTPAEGWVSDEGATLGRVLFYDTKLSANGTIACASCHQQPFGFSDSARFSRGHLGGLTGRHSMGLSNARFRAYGEFFWDARAASLEDQVLMPFQDPVEMGLTLDQLVDIVSSQPYYPILFKRAYGNSEISADRISNALAQFVRSMVSFESRYDEGRKKHRIEEDFRNFTQLENQGKSIFFDVKKGNCGGCHFTEAFVMDVPRNNGLDVWESSNDNDIGYEKTTDNALDRGKFIAPSLRNIAVRPPYMHDGRFKTLREVVNHYSEGIVWSSTLDDHLKSGMPNTPIRLNLSEAEKEALIAFLETLTDQTVLTHPKFSNPFK